MLNLNISLQAVFEGWDGYQQSIVRAVQPLTPEQLNWHPANHLRTVGELVRHIALGRLTWLMRMDAPGSAELASQIGDWELDEDGNRDIVEKAVEIADQPEELVRWLELTWKVIENTLSSWTVADLWQTYRHKFLGNTYAVSRQWTIWRVMNHDLHHGGELSLMLGLQGIEAFELSALFGHIIEPPLAED